jgi:hypothetical protein
MKTEEFDEKTVTICIQQKVTLFTNILNISKQIEVQTRQPQIILNDLFVKRKTMMDRIDMCNALIEQQLSYLPEIKRLHWHRILHDTDYAPLDENEKVLCILINKSRELCFRIEEINRTASANLNRERTILQNHINEERSINHKK